MNVSFSYFIIHHRIYAVITLRTSEAEYIVWRLSSVCQTCTNNKCQSESLKHGLESDFTSKTIHKSDSRYITQRIGVNRLKFNHLTIGDVIIRVQWGQYWQPPNQSNNSQSNYSHQGRVANPRPVSEIKTGLVSQPITDADDETGRDRSCIATRPRSYSLNQAQVQLLKNRPMENGLTSNSFKSNVQVRTQNRNT